MSQLQFLYSQDKLQEIANDIIDQAIKSGASSAQVEISESISTDLEVLNQNIENFETSHENQLLITVFNGHKKGNVGISNINAENIDTIINQALDIAKYTEEDKCSGILEKKYLASPIPKNLQLYNPYNINNEELISEARELEQLAIDNNNIKSSDGSSVSMTHYNFVTANSNGFNDGYQTSRYSKYVSLIGENEHGMQTDYWYASSRAYQDLETNQYIASLAQDRVIRRLSRATVESGSPAIIFESQIAKSIIGSLMNAISGSNQYRKLSFLNDCLDKQVLPSWINIHEDPFVVKGLSSCYFDNEGCEVIAKNIIANGIVNNYLLSSYPARKLGMDPTGNAGGNHNLNISNNISGNIATLAKTLGNGIIIIETIGQGLNMVTGDYSVGASGLVIKEGIIKGYVDNLTISGNMVNIFNNIVYISDDYNFGSVNCGSMIINPGIINVTTK